MGITKVITTTAKTVIENTPVKKNTTSVIAKTSTEVYNIFPELKGILSENAKYHGYSPKVQETITNFRDQMWKYCQEKN